MGKFAENARKAAAGIKAETATEATPSEGDGAINEPQKRPKECATSVDMEVCRQSQYSWHI